MICLMMSNVPTRVLSLLLSNFGRRKVSTRSGKEQAAGMAKGAMGNVLRCAPMDSTHGTVPHGGQDAMVDWGWGHSFAL